MALSTINMTVASVITEDESTILAFACDSVSGTVGQITYGGDFEDYTWVQNEVLTTAGVAVQPYGALIVPTDKLDDVDVKSLEITSGGMSGKPSQSLETKLSSLEVGSTVAFTLA